MVTSGIDAAIKNFSDMSRRGQRAYISAVRVEAELIMTESQRQVPVATGNLKSSKFVIAEEKADGVTVVLGYRAEYALFVHEIPPERANHPDGKWKYLEDPMKKAIPGFDRRVRDRMMRELQRR